MKNYADRGGCYPPKPKAEADNEICIILHIIRKPNSIIALLFIQNISRALKIYIFLIGFCRVHEKIARYLKTMNKKQAKNDQQNFIQGSDKFAVRSKIRMNFLRVRSPRNTHKNHIYRAVALSKYRKASFEVSKFGFHFLAVIRIALENRRIVNSKAHFVVLRR